MRCPFDKKDCDRKGIGVDGVCRYGGWEVENDAYRRMLPSGGNSVAPQEHLELPFGMPCGMIRINWAPERKKAKSVAPKRKVKCRCVK